MKLGDKKKDAIGIALRGFGDKPDHPVTTRYRFYHIFMNNPVQVEMR